MDGAAGILVIILGLTLAVFLVLAVVLMILLIRVTKQIKSITDSAERTVHNVESAANNMSRFAMPVAAARAVRQVLSKKEATHGKRK